jgi:hypothetical protein
MSNYANADSKSLSSASQETVRLTETENGTKPIDQPAGRDKLKDRPRPSSSRGSAASWGGAWETGLIMLTVGIFLAGLALFDAIERMVDESSIVSYLVRGALLFIVASAAIGAFSALKSGGSNINGAVDMAERERRIGSNPYSKAKQDRSS